MQVLQYLLNAEFLCKKIIFVGCNNLSWTGLFFNSSAFSFFFPLHFHSHSLDIFFVFHINALSVLSLPCLIWMRSISQISYYLWMLHFATILVAAINLACCLLHYQLTRQWHQILIVHYRFVACIWLTIIFWSRVIYLYFTFIYFYSKQNLLSVLQYSSSLPQNYYYYYSILIRLRLELC